MRRDGVENKDLLERWGERGGGGERGGREGWERKARFGPETPEIQINYSGS